MNNYKDLIADLRHYFYDTELVLEAADAIEQLVKERDAAVADIPHDCGYCKWYVESDDECVQNFPCVSVNSKWEWHGEHWEWSGVQEVSK